MGDWAAQFWDIQEASLTTLFRTNIMVSTTQTLYQIKSLDFSGHIKKALYHNILSHVTDGIQGFVNCTSTFDLTTCYLVDYNL